MLFPFQVGFHAGDGIDAVLLPGIHEIVNSQKGAMVRQGNMPAAHPCRPGNNVLWRLGGVVQGKGTVYV